MGRRRGGLVSTGDRARRKPMCGVDVSSACGDRAAGRYRRQYWGEQRCDPPLSTRRGIREPGSALVRRRHPARRHRRVRIRLPARHLRSDHGWTCRSRWSTPRCCRTCRAGRSRWAERCLRRRADPPACAGVVVRKVSLPLVSPRVVRILRLVSPGVRRMPPRGRARPAPPA